MNLSTWEEGLFLDFYFCLDYVKTLRLLSCQSFLYISSLVMQGISNTVLRFVVPFVISKLLRESANGLTSCFFSWLPIGKLKHLKRALLNDQYKTNARPISISRIKLTGRFITLANFIILMYWNIVSYF